MARRIPAFALLASCLLLAVGSGVLAIYIVMNEIPSGDDELRSVQHLAWRSHAAAIADALTLRIDLLRSTSRAAAFDLLVQAASQQGSASFLSNPENFRSDLQSFSETLATLVEAQKWMSVSVSAVYPSTSTDTVVLSLGHLVEARHGGSQAQYRCSPLSLVSNISACVQLERDPVTGQLSTASATLYSNFSYSSADALSGAAYGAADFLEPSRLHVSRDGFAYHVLVFRTSVVINGIRVVVQAAQPLDQEVDALVRSFHVLSDTQVMLVDQFERVVAYGAQSHDACCSAVQQEGSNCTACAEAPARQHLDLNVRELAAALLTPAMLAPSSAGCGEYNSPGGSVDFINRGGAARIGRASCVVDRDGLRLVVLWSAARLAGSSIKIYFLVILAILAILPTLILCLVVLVSVVLPVKTLGTFVFEMACDLAAPESEDIADGRGDPKQRSWSSVILEVNDLLVNIDLLRQATLTVTKYVPRDLVRREVLAVLGMTDEEDELEQALQELEDEGDLSGSCSDDDDDSLCGQHPRASRAESLSVVPPPVIRVGSSGANTAAATATAHRPMISTKCDSPLSKSGLEHSTRSVESATLSLPDEAASSVRRNSNTNRHPSMWVSSSGEFKRAASSLSSRKKVTVAVMNLCNFHSQPHLLDMFPKIITAVNKCVKNHKGVLDFFHGDHFFASFNALTSCALHARSGMAMYCELTVELSQLDVQFTAGITSGDAVVCKLGNDSVKNFSVVSPIVSDAVTLERHCRHTLLHARGLALASMESDAAFVSHYHFCRPLHLASEGRKAHVLSLYPKAWELASSTAHEAVEWMYELETCSKRDPFSAVNALAHAVINGEDPLAKARAQSLLDDLPRTAHGGESLDAVALRELLEL